MDWSLDELEAQVAAALQAAEVGPLNGQIAEVPNARTIRYYTTIGLLDRPRQAGRAAVYGRRHLEQIVAIKRLQAKGLPLADIQRQVPALSDGELAALAALPTASADAPEVHGPEQKRESRRDRAFWNAEPADASPVPLPAPAPAPAPAAGTAITGITLANGVTLTFPSERALSAADLEAIRAALVGVTETLRARGLVPDELAPEKKEEAP